jgi:ATP-dependent protease ClpP protease subunit
MSDITQELVRDIKINAFLEDRTIYITEIIENETELIVCRMLDKIKINDDLEGLEVKDRKPIHLQINSIGGNAFAGLGIVSKIQHMQDLGYVFVAHAGSVCMSAAFMIYIVCDLRFALRHSYFMIHQNQLGIEEYFGSSENLKRISKQQDIMWGRLKGIIKQYTALDDDYLDRMVDNDMAIYFWSEDALLWKVCCVVE